MLYQQKKKEHAAPSLSSFSIRRVSGKFDGRIGIFEIGNDVSFIINVAFEFEFRVCSTLFGKIRFDVFDIIVDLL